MQNARILGMNIKALAQSNQISDIDLGNRLGYSEVKIRMLFSGRSFPTYHELVRIAGILNTTVGSLLKNDYAQYNETIVHCMNQFSDQQNRESILDIIDNYMDIKDALISK